MVAQPTSLERIVVLGTSGSGKSHFATRAAEALGSRHVELDALHWRPGWAQAPRDEFRRQVAEIVAEPNWVLDGNYLAGRDLVWPRATAVIWLRYPFPRVFVRLLRRSIRRLVTGERVCNGNRESFRSLFLSRDSLFVWAIRSHPELATQIPDALREYPHLETHVFDGPRETEGFLGSLRRMDGGDRA